MSFMTSTIKRFAAEKNVAPDELAKIEQRAAEATRDYGGADGEFAHSKLTFVLGRTLAEKFRQAHHAPA